MMESESSPRTNGRDVREMESTWATDEGLPGAAVDAIQATYPSIFTAADAAYTGDTDDLHAIDGVGPKTVAALADLSPLAIGGEWTATALGGVAEYEFTTGAATVTMREQPTEDGATSYDISVDYTGDEPLLAAYRAEQDIPRGRVSAWWVARDILTTNPHGPGSTIPKNVPTPGPWFLQTNHHRMNGGYRSGWENRDTRERLDIYPGDSALPEGAAQPDTEADAFLTYRSGFRAAPELLADA